MTSFDVQFWQIETRKGRKPRVRWVVAGNKFGESFTTKGLAEAFRAKLITAARNGEAFSTDTGLPQSMERKLRNITFYQHALEFTAAAWPAAAAKTRVSIIESLAWVDTRRHPGPARRPRPGHPQASAAQEAQPGRARGRAGPRRDQSHRLDPAGIPPGQHPGRPLQSSQTSSTPWPSASTANPPAPNTSPAAAASCTNASATPSARNGSPPTRSAKPTCPKAGPPPPNPTTPSTPAPSAAPNSSPPCSSLRHHRQTARPALPSLLRLHVLRPDAPLRSRRPHQSQLPPPRTRLGPPDLRRLQPRRRAAPTPTTARSTSTAASKAAPKAGPAPAPAGPPARSRSPRSSSPCCATTSRPTAPPPTAACSAPSAATPSSPPPGGRSGRKSEPPPSPPTSSPRRS